MSDTLDLTDNSRIAIVGGGPAGALFAYFLLESADRVDLKLHVDIFEPRDFSKTGPAGCNMCAGVVSESLVQMLAIEGINLPHTVVHRGIDSYVLNTDSGYVMIQPPEEEQRIAALFRGGGPPGAGEEFESLDGYLLHLACAKGANHIQARVENIEMRSGKPVIMAKKREPEEYDLLIGAVGVNTPTLRMFEGMGIGYKSPKTTKTFITEVYMGKEGVERYFGNSLHVFLQNIPGVQFASIIPKGEYVTVCLLGEDITNELVRNFLDSPEVTDIFPDDWKAEKLSCKCLPKINVASPKNYFSDRVIMIGDCGVSKLYKDGIGSAYRLAKVAANTAILQGISKKDFDKFLNPVCRSMKLDNFLGQMVFGIVAYIQKIGFLKRAMVNLTQKEQVNLLKDKTMSSMLWDTFTGSASYTEVISRSFKPIFLYNFAVEIFHSIFNPNK